MRFVTLAIVLALLAGCGEDDEQPAAPAPASLAELVVTVDPDGGGGEPPKETTVSCTAPDDSEACRAAANLSPEDFEPTPDDVACTQQFGGPETATVTGTLDGEPIDARFSRANGCEIARWETVTPLLEAAR